MRDARLSAIIATRDYHSLAEFIRSGKDQETEVSSKRDRGKAKNKSKRHSNNTKDGNQTDKVDDRPSPTTSKAGKGLRNVDGRYLLCYVNIYYILKYMIKKWVNKFSLSTFSERFKNKNLFLVFMSRKTFCKWLFLGVGYNKVL